MLGSRPQGRHSARKPREGTRTTDEITQLRRDLDTSGSARLRTADRGMLPAIAPGAVVDVRPRPFCEVRPGDVVVAGLARRAVAHRVVERSGAGLLTLGDNLPLVDPVVRPGDYLGVVAEHHRPVPPPRRPDLAALATVPDLGVGRTRMWFPGPPPAYAWWNPAARPGATPGRSHGIKRLVISVSPHGALPAAALDELFRAAGRRDIDVLLGCAFTGPAADRPAAVGWRPPLRPGTADFHVGFGTPLDPPPLIETVAFVRSRIRAVRGLPEACGG
ncbi:S26 family signal peptidase [Streptomyces sp. FH025]|uniref:S26 family signal peptidase n=1 Tax=Streptomyces sp. FH025 TaxID=2815937 RepID=UPI001A9EA976|nr:S26 family signal peptidase [Streptomyces sp. FH025]MBO1418709.1 S26 family signal peptidase [Streptomyces sp. FH025]